MYRTAGFNAQFKLISPDVGVEGGITPCTLLHLGDYILSCCDVVERCLVSNYRVPNSRVPGPAWTLISSHEYWDSRDIGQINALMPGG